MARHKPIDFNDFNVSTFNLLYSRFCTNIVIITESFLIGNRIKKQYDFFAIVQICNFFYKINCAKNTYLRVRKSMY